jgi:hypothetical protein
LVRVLWLIISASILAQGFFVLVWTAPGPLSIDEVLYHRMVTSLVDGHGLMLWNGYEEFASAELTARYISAFEGRLAAQYPHGFPAVAAPVYALLGYRGLFLVNAVAFVGVAALCYRIAMQLIRDQRVAAGASAILVGGTFSWEYSQAAWPHALTLLLILGFVSLGIDAFLSTERARAVRFAAAAGLVAGFACTVRLDAVLCLSALLLPSLVVSPIRLREVGAAAAGMAPGLVALAVTNWIKWGTPVPFSYGSASGLQLSRYLLLIAILICGATAVVISTRPKVRAWLATGPRKVLVAGALLLGLMLLLVPVARGELLRLLSGAHAILVDLRELPLDAPGAAMTRTPTGGVLYWGGYKKALLQSVPYIVLLVVPVVLAVRSRKLREPMLILSIIPLTLGVFFSYYSWHGGLCYNMRYLLPALPFLSILCAWGLREVGKGAVRHWLLISLGAAVGSFALHVLLRPGDHSAHLEPFLYVTPLVIAFLLGLALAVWILRPGKWVSTAAVAIAGIGFGWGGAVGFTYDARWSRQHRANNHAIAKFTAENISSDSILFVDFPDSFYGVIEYRDRVRIAMPGMDEFKDAGPLLRFHLEHGRRAYGAFGPDWWGMMQASGALEGMEVRPIAHIGRRVLAEIQPESPP